jgi:hypothetical protein
MGNRPDFPQGITWLVRLDPDGDGRIYLSMKMSRPPQAKIVAHTAGLGVPSPDTVRQRAMELAKIDGRTRFSEEDWKQAKRELHGGHSGFSDNGTDDEMIQSVSIGMVPGTVGHHSEKMGYDEGENMVEELIAEGMDEAVHDRMLMASELNAEDIEEEV